ncbi:MAG: nickel-dependent lactate racemase [Bacillota bacterium]|nr:nickel-dependent lactate racemase [Bacillota bacterium]MDD3297864.1 nickel-dependent lactate racemase [Bacillota bacterium]MDD3850315.1 nickel-dependent lactate racemase [Bacillota bacterium]MDD4706987.1 nickel-dependent lactate racemase [Bacillota bacterium]
MPAIDLKFGKNTVKIEVPPQNLMDVLEGRFKEGSIDEDYERIQIKEALQNPIGAQRLSSMVNRGHKVVIMASDITRPSPTRKLLPPLLEELLKAGVSEEDIKIIFGMGIHRPHTLEEQKALVGEQIFNAVRCVDSNKEDYISIGSTEHGTPLNICRSVVEADVRICTGNIEYHYFAGYSGGAKAIMPGAANYESIKYNHSRQLERGSETGRLEGNPVREDIDEIGRILGISFILNAVLNEKKQVLKAFAGHYLEAHRAGCRYLDGLYRIDVPEPADIVIVSAGGYPKDINLYQAQKALDNASHVVKVGGIIILVAECEEGYGEDTFARWIMEADLPQHLEDRLKMEFVLGGHKAAAIARVVKKAEVFMISAMDKRDIEAVFFTKKESVQKALDDAISIVGKHAKVLVIPQGGSVFPSVE